MRKRGQAAMEFLMTYGWAILVVLAAIGALAYFGVLSPDRFLAEKCVLAGGVVCLDHTFDSTSGFTLRLQNAAGFDMTGVTVSINGTGCNAGGTGSGTLSDGEQASYTYAACNALTGKFRGDVTVAYTNSFTGLAHTKTGEIVARAS